MASANMRFYASNATTLKYFSVKPAFNALVATLQTVWSVYICMIATYAHTLQLIILCVFHIAIE